GLGQQSQGIFIGPDFFAAHDVAQLPHNIVKLHRSKTEVLAARPDRLWNVLRLGSRQHEDDVVGRLFQSLQQRVKCGVSDLVGFIENVNLEAVASRPVARSLAQLANFVNAPVRRRVDFDHVHRVAGANLGARFTDSAGLRHRLVGGAAVERHGQNAGDGGFPDAAMAAEDVTVGGSSLLNGVLQRARDVLLSDDLGEFLGTVFARQDGVTHELKKDYT